MSEVRMTIDAEVFERLPNLCLGVIIAKGIDNTLERPEVERMLDDAVADAQALLEGIKASEDPRVQPYREAFHELGMSPSRYPSSNIALLKRVAKGQGVWRVNPLVDLGNCISISSGLPLGVHDMGEGGELTLRFSRADDIFIPLGESEPDETLEPDELIYAHGNIVQTRRWTWRQSEHGKIGPNTETIIVPIDGFIGINDDEIVAARDELAALLTEVFGCKPATFLIDASNPTAAI